MHIALFIFISVMLSIMASQDFFHTVPTKYELLHVKYSISGGVLKQ